MSAEASSSTDHLGGGGVEQSVGCVRVSVCLSTTNFGGRNEFWRKYLANTLIQPNAARRYALKRCLLCEDRGQGSKCLHFELEDPVSDRT